MNEKMFELMQSRGELLARIASQREQMTEIGAHWRTPLALADQGVAAVHFARSHPVLIGGVVGMVKGTWRLWKTYRSVPTFATSHPPASESVTLVVVSNLHALLRLIQSLLFGCAAPCQFV